MTKSNVVSMDEFCEMREARKVQENYKKYLVSLANSQLETEINYLLDEFSLDTYGKDFFSKVRLVQNELVSRADDDWKVRIEQLNNHQKEN